MLRLLFGVLLLPLAGALDWAAAKALVGAATGSSAAAPFLAGMALTAVGWLLLSRVLEPVGAAGWGLRAARWAYVAGHELTHALAAWSSGGKVFAIHVQEDGGHVDLSESSAFVALAPYCVPFHALLVVAAYRVFVWLKPETPAESVFLVLMGAALAFHGLMTWETLTQVRQPDLKAAGGIVFSLSLIAAVNGLMVLVLLKALFPESVALAASVKGAGLGAWRFWSGAWGAAAPAAKSLQTRWAK